MAQRVLGIDLGASCVKVAELEVGFRTVQLSGLRTYPVASGPEPAHERALEALGALPAVEEGTIVCAAVPGDRVLMRVLEVPFSDARKVQAVVINELADEIPWEMDDVVVDHLATKHARGLVLAAAARRDELQRLLDGLGALGCEPRELRVSPLGYGSLLRRLYPDETVMLVDIGHQRTDICVAEDGHPLIARTVSRGGHQITEALRQAFHLSYEEAEQFKHQHALVADDPDELEAAPQRIATATARAIIPLVSEVRRTVDLAQVRAGVVPQRVVLCGGTSQLSGLQGYLGLELDLPVERLDLAGDAELAQMDLSAEGQLVGALALGVALEHGRRQSLDLRRGVLSFKADSSFLRDKAWVVAGSVVLVLFCIMLSVWASLYSLGAEHERLSGRLEQATRQLFGQPLSDPYRVSRRLKVAAGKAGSEIPEGSAVDVLELLSKRVPAKDEVQIDVTRLDIRSGKTQLRGVANSGSAVGKIIKSLEQADCFADVSSGRVSETGDGKKQFSLTITTKCF